MQCRDYHYLHTLNKNDDNSSILPGGVTTILRTPPAVRGKMLLRHHWTKTLLEPDPAMSTHSAAVGSNGRSRFRQQDRAKFLSCRKLRGVYSPSSADEETHGTEQHLSLLTSLWEDFVSLITIKKVFLEIDAVFFLIKTWTANWMWL